jgi:4-diphosphocytidyl-2C-methyl-D-erythritol kinase
MNEVKLKIYAKINLCLAVTGREGNLHTLDTIMSSINLYDVICAKKRSDGEITVTFDGVDGKNSNAYNSAVMMRDVFGAGGVDIEIFCHIPSGAGMGSSSADSAGVIRAMQMLYDLTIDENELREHALRIGSDVPYMLYGGMARLQGTGTNLTFIDYNGCDEVLVSGEGNVNTGKCFAVFDAMEKCAHSKTDVDVVAGSLLSNGVNGSKEILFNDLQNSAQTLNEHIEKISVIMRECELTPVMTGSGATVVGYGNKDQFDLAKDKLRANNYTSRVVAFNKKGYETL